MTANTWLIIGYGNSLRRDDGAGLLLASRLADALARRGIAVELIQTHQLTLELAPELALPQVALVLFVDACMGGTTAKGLCVGKISPHPGAATLGHALAPALLLTLAARLYGHAPAALSVTVPGCDFAHGESLSASVRRLIDDDQAIGMVLDRAAQSVTTFPSR